MAAWWIIFIIVPMILVILGFLLSITRGRNYHPHWGGSTIRSSSRNTKAETPTPIYTVNPNPTATPPAVVINPNFNAQLYPSDSEFTPSATPAPPRPPPPHKATTNMAPSSWQSAELYPAPPPYTEVGAFESKKLFY